MSLLKEIQDAAVSSSSDLSETLRKCKVLAARLGNKPLEDWFLWESNGYPSDNCVPDYRIFKAQLKGDFINALGGGFKNINVSLFQLPKQIQAKYQYFYCKQSIASLEQLLKEDNQSSLQASTGDLKDYLHNRVLENHQCFNVWLSIEMPRLIEILNVVRHKVLDFTIALEKEYPELMNEDNKPNNIDPVKVTNIFNTINGGSVNMVHHAENSTINQSIAVNDFEALSKVFQNELGLLQDDIDELRTALDEDAKPTEKGKFGPKVSSWMGKILSKTASGAFKVTTDVAAAVIVKAISVYYGIE